MDGQKNRSKLLDKLAFGGFNKKIENPNTVKDWLSRDPEIVQNMSMTPFVCKYLCLNSLPTF